MDLIMISRYKQQLHTSNLQFALKPGHSTVMCNLTLKEIVTYYMNRDTDVYCIALDASKVFDRVRYDKLFHVLVSKGMPSIFTTFLMDMYERQLVHSTWNSNSIINGIRQGGMISQLLYTVYADALIDRLEKEGNHGCHIGHEFYGCVSYADDMNLLCPSVLGTQMMIDTCTEFGIEHDILYNERKTMAMCFSRKREMPTFNVSMNGTKLTCVQEMKHLGITMTYNFNDQPEISKKQGDFISRTNHVINKYGCLDSEVQSRLFLANCMSHYGCETWTYQCPAFKNILTSWNIAIRKLWDLPWRAHRAFLPSLVKCKPLDVTIYCRFINVVFKMCNSSNNKISLITNSAIMDSRSFIKSNMQFIAGECNMYTEVLLNNMPNVKDILGQQQCDDDVIQTTEHLRELKQCLDGFIEIPGFSNEEINFMYDSIATD